MRGFIKKYIGEVMTIIGFGLFTYNVLNFSYKAYGRTISPGYLPKVPSIGPEIELEGIAYYYYSDTLLLIAVGIMLIVAGILVIRNKKRG